MSLQDEFRVALAAGIASLVTDEWAVTKAREKVLSGVTSAEAFDSISGILSLAGRQTDAYAFASCCWFVMDLVRLSDTTQSPKGLHSSLISVRPVAESLGVKNELAPIAKWYRFEI